MYIVDLGLRRTLRFATVEDARKFCADVLDKTGEVLAIKEGDYR